MPGIYRPGGTGVPEGGGSAQGGAQVVVPTTGTPGLKGVVGTPLPTKPVGPVGPTIAPKNQWGQTPAQVIAMQTFLKNRGFYSGPLDGMRGNGTNAAISAFHNRNTKAPSGKNGSTGGGSGSVATDPTTDAITAATTALAPSSSDTPIIDPVTYAQGATNAVYNPQLAALAQQIVSGKAQGTTDQKDLQDWFNQLQGLASSTGKSVASSDAAAQAGYDQSSNNALSQLFGGGTAPNSTTAEAQTFHDIGAGQLRSNDQADQDFNARMKSILSASGSEAANNQLNKDNASVQGLAAQKIALLGAKGNAYNANLQQGYQEAQQQSAAQQAQKLAAAMAGPQVAAATANAVTAESQASTAPAIAAANLALVNAKVKQATALAGSQGWNLAVPAQRGALTSAFKTSIMGQNQGLKVSPDVAWNNIQQSLIQAGLSGNTQAVELAKSVFLEGLHNSHNSHNFGGWAWSPKLNKVVQTGNTYNGKGQLVNKAGKVIPNYTPKG